MGFIDRFATMKEEDFVSFSIREFRRMKKLADDAVAQVSEESFFDQTSEGDNSLALLYKHMAGNMRSRWTDFMTTDGEKSDRNRDDEFQILEPDSYMALVARWDEA